MGHVRSEFLNVIEGLIHQSQLRFVRHQNFGRTLLGI